VCVRARARVRVVCVLTRGGDDGNAEQSRLWVKG